MTNPVTQDDREYAASFILDNGSGPWQLLSDNAAVILAGYDDDNELVQFACFVRRLVLEKDVTEAIMRASRVPELDLAGEHAVTISDAIRALAEQE